MLCQLNMENMYARVVAIKDSRNYLIVFAVMVVEQNLRKKMNKTTYNELENLSNEYKEENSDLSVDEFRNDIMFKNMIGMEDCQLKAAIHEHLKSINYYQTLYNKSCHQPTETVFDGDCWCYFCDQKRRDNGIIGAFDFRMNLCPECGNKRCPKATNHDFECTDSNEAGQEGSLYKKAP